jgi:hypothetical protein
MANYDARKIVGDVVAEAMKAQEAFVQNIEALSKRGDCRYRSSY